MAKMQDCFLQYDGCISYFVHIQLSSQKFLEAKVRILDIIRAMACFLLTVKLEFSSILETIKIFRVFQESKIESNCSTAEK